MNAVILREAVYIVSVLFALGKLKIVFCITMRKTKDI